MQVKRQGAKQKTKVNTFIIYDLEHDGDLRERQCANPVWHLNQTRCTHGVWRTLPS